MLRKAASLFLLIVLPACAAFPPFAPPPPAPGVQKTDDALFQEAEASYRHQAYQQAYQRYTAYLERYPQGSQASTARWREAELLGLLGDWQGSLRRYQSLLDRQPEPDIALKARYGMGRAYFKLGEYQQATQILDSLTASDLPRSLWFSTQALLAEIALKQGRINQAFSRLRLAGQDLPSGDPEWFEDLKTRLLEQATPAELEQLVTLYRDSPVSAALLLRLGKLAQEGNRTDEARQWINTLKERFPNTPEAKAGDSLLAGGGKTILGCLLPLSGQLSNIGFRVQRGMELAARRAPLELVFRDTRNDPNAAAQLTRELAQNDRVLAILGPISSAVAESAATAAQAARLPLLALSQKDGLTKAGDLVFQAFLTPSQQVHGLVQQLSARGIRRFAILYPDSSYGRTFLQNFQEEVTAQGGELAAQELYAPGTQDFNPVLATLQDALKQAPEQPDGTALFIPDDAAVVANIAGQLAATPLKGIQLLGTNLLHNSALSGTQVTTLEGILFPDAFFAGDPDPGVQKFITAYKQQYGEDPDYLAAQGYLVVQVMRHLLESEKSISRLELPRQLLAHREVPGLPWFRGFNADRVEEAAPYLLTIKDGRIQMVTPGSGAPLRL
jgi:branched-chain amino acid transport system substrate-binding protein